MKNASVAFNHHAIFDYNLKSVYDKKNHVIVLWNCHLPVMFHENYDDIWINHAPVISGRFVKAEKNK